MSTVIEEWGMCCPNCGRDDAIDILAQVAVRLTPEGTDPDEARDGHHEWGDDNSAVCVACEHTGKVEDFRTEG